MQGSKGENKLCFYAFHLSTSQHMLPCCLPPSLQLHYRKECLETGLVGKVSMKVVSEGRSSGQAPAWAQAV